MLDEVEVATYMYNDVHVVWNVHEAMELFRAAAVVVLRYTLTMRVGMGVEP